MSFITDEVIDDFKTPGEYADGYNFYYPSEGTAKYQTADAKTVELKIEATPVLLIP